MELQKLWIGDRVRMLISGRTGTYEGMAKDGRARVRSGNKTYLVSPKNISPYHEGDLKNNKLVKLILEERQQLYAKPAKSIPNSIDLHLVSLAPDLQHQLPQHILNFQIKKCKEYIEKALSLNYKHFTIIHGKGTGLLRNEVLHLMQSYERIAYHIPQSEGGAIEVWTK